MIYLDQSQPSTRRASKADSDPRVSRHSSAATDKDQESRDVVEPGNVAIDLSDESSHWGEALGHVIDNSADAGMFLSSLSLCGDSAMGFVLNRTVKSFATNVNRTAHHIKMRMRAENCTCTYCEGDAIFDKSSVMSMSFRDIISHLY